MTNVSIEYRTDEIISTDQFVDVLTRSTLAERRPVGDRACIEGMLAEADLLVTAWHDDRLVGVARSLTDFHYCCYLSDLAVDIDYQRRGIGRQLIESSRKQLWPECIIILLAAPAAVDYYPRIGFEPHNSAWILKPGEDLN